MNETEHSSKVKTKASVSNVKAQPKDKNKGEGSKASNPIVAEITKLTSQVSQLTGLHSGLKGEMEKLKKELQTPVPLGWYDPEQGMWGPPAVQEEEAPVVGDAAQINSLNTANFEGSTAGGRGRGRDGFFKGPTGMIYGRGGHNPFGGRMGCIECVAKGAFCRHCFFCGEKGHDCTK